MIFELFGKNCFILVGNAAFNWLSFSLRIVNAPDAMKGIPPENSFFSRLAFCKTVDLKAGMVP